MLFQSSTVLSILITTQSFLVFSHPFPQDDVDIDVPNVPTAAETAQTLQGVGELVMGILQGVAALNIQSPFRGTTPAPTKAPAAAVQPQVQVLPANWQQLLAGANANVVAVPVAATAAPAKAAAATAVESGDDDDEDISAKKYRQN